jgi:SAM-dependent methyltransferase
VTDSVKSPDRTAAHRLLARHLVGDGIELGPGHHPFVQPYPGVTVRYVDRWEPAENRELFPELGAGAEFAKPDVVANLDTDRLSALPDASQDFVIASHVLEHVAEPLGQLADMHRVLRPGGTALVLLPDRRHTFDSERTPTPLAHLVAEHERGVETVDDDHVEDFLRSTGEQVDQWAPADRAAHFDLHRRRSIHVHVWSEDEWVDVLEHAVRAMELEWVLVDALFVQDVRAGMEFGVVLRRTLTPLPPEVAADRLRAVWTDLRLVSSRGAAADRARHAAEDARQAAEEARNAAEMALDEERHSDTRRLAPYVAGLRRSRLAPVLRLGLRGYRRGRGLVRRTPRS